MSAKTAFEGQPVTVVQALTAALVATVNALALIFSWSVEVTAALNLMIGAWVTVAGFILAAKTTAKSKVALTKDDVTLIEASYAQKAR